MTLERTFADLLIQLTRLREALEGLGTTVDEDRPQRGDVVVAASLGDAVLVARGFLEDSRAAAERVRQAVEQRLDSDRARRELTACQEQFHRFVTQFHSDLFSYERLDDLASIARERGQDWSSWADVVRQELQQCRALVDEVRDVLFLCWQELLERVCTASVSVQNTTIGQQIYDADLSGRRTAREAVT